MLEARHSQIYLMHQTTHTDARPVQPLNERTVVRYQVVKQDLSKAVSRLSFLVIGAIILVTTVALFALFRCWVRYKSQQLFTVEEDGHVQYGSA